MMKDDDTKTVSDKASEVNNEAESETNGLSLKHFESALQTFSHQHRLSIQILLSMTEALERELLEIEKRSAQKVAHYPAGMSQRLRSTSTLLSTSARRAETAGQTLLQEYVALRTAEGTGTESLESLLQAPPLRPSNRVLVADDDVLVREVLTSMLEERGYCVVSVADGGAAISEADMSSYDLVLMDCRMPTTDGFEASLGILLGNLLKHPPAIVGITHSDPDEYEIPARESGMLEVVEKPVSPDTLDRLLFRYSPMPAHENDAVTVRMH